MNILKSVWKIFIKFNLFSENTDRLSSELTNCYWLSQPEFYKVYRQSIARIWMINKISQIERSVGAPNSENGDLENYMWQKEELIKNDWIKFIDCS